MTFTAVLLGIMLVLTIAASQYLLRARDRQYAGAVRRQQGLQEAMRENARLWKLTHDLYGHACQDAPEAFQVLACQMIAQAVNDLNPDDRHV